MNIPEGYTHQADLINKGWKAAQIKELLFDNMIKVEVPADSVNISNKAYKDEAIANIENGENNSPTAKLVVKQIKAEASLTKSTTVATSENTISRAAILYRGWGVADIKNFLGQPDLKELTMMGFQHRFLLEKVEKAETTNLKLSAKITKKNESKKEAIESVLEEGKAVFRKVNDEWVISGKNLKKGNTVEVEKKNGETQKVVVGAIIKTEGETQTAKFSKAAYSNNRNTATVTRNDTANTNASPAIKENKNETQTAKPVEITANNERKVTLIVEGDIHETATAINTKVGETLTVKGEVVTVTAIEYITRKLIGIDDDFYTARLQVITVVPADDNAIEEYATATKEQHRKNALINAMYKTILATVVKGRVDTTAVFANPASKYTLSSVAVRLVGGGITAYIEEATVPHRKIIFSDARGMDGDSWGAYNGGNEIISIAAYSPELEEAIKLVAGDIA